MRQFAETYQDRSIVQQVVAQISRGHNIALLHKCKTAKERLWYAQKALEHGWSRNVMLAQIETGLFHRE
jgi:predicted nuclease of restriction endonuclease-like (RecB) superfamily